MQKTVRWYERERWRYTADRKTVAEYAEWVKEAPWNQFCTFTFAWGVSDPQADKIFAAFINDLERHIKCVVGYVRGDEKRFSGCGKPACARHFHALLTSIAPLQPDFVEWLWMEMAGHRSDHAGAKVEIYDPAQDGAEYVLKSINQVHGDWTFGRLELFHPEAKSLHTVNARWRRRLRHFKAAEAKLWGNNNQQPATNIAIKCNGMTK